MGLLKRNNPPYDTFLFRSAARPGLGEWAKKRGFSAISGVKAVSKAAADGQTPNSEGFRWMWRWGI